MLASLGWMTLTITSMISTIRKMYLDFDDSVDGDFDVGTTPSLVHSARKLVNMIDIQEWIDYFLPK